ncbi:hypothetical protein K1T71_001405 [Dendrolimus kikuchii]|uniref:Uncharacterized protein n=1 Tax=Dendrolimus kikuchii TaxID=765133 RepID=A0ACC1DI45_9NEOP|nr:hypothetical protein K1T71_001405 [Dendrolimus kikuchii]
MSSSKGLRITCKRTRPNPLFQEWLEDLHQEAQEKHSKLEPMLKEALDSISKYPLPLKSGSECAILKGFEKKLCIYLDKCLDSYNSQNTNRELCTNIHTKDTPTTSNKPHERSNNPVSSTINEKLKEQPQNSNSSSSVIKYNKNSQTEVSSGEDKELESSSASTLNQASSSKLNINPTSLKSKNMKKDKTYKPALRSGGYAILVALLENLKECPNSPALNKDKLIELAQKHSEESFTRPKPDSFYTAWSNMSRLITKGLVVKSRSKKVVYSLTDQGLNLAEELVKDSAMIPTVNDIIFNNETAKENNHNVINKHINNFETNSTNEGTIKMLAGSFDIILLIDKSETGGVSKKHDPTVTQFNKYPNLRHEYRSLKVGDFTWIAQNKSDKNEELVLPYIVERKRMDDLAASIKDGRFHEQKFRLRKCGLKNVVYLVENYGKNRHVGLPLQSLMQALANTRVQDGFKVHVTDSLTDSARFLAIITKILSIEYKDKNLKGGDKEPSSDELMSFNFFNKSSMKTKALTVTETFIKILLQLKGVSVEKALAITREYSTPWSLIEKYKRCSEKDGQLLLANLKYGDTDRNVGPSVSKSIYYLFTSS